MDADSIGLPIVSIGIAVIWQGSVDDLKLRIANRRLMGWLGLFVSGLCVFMAVLALVDGEFEPAPLLLAWAYIALAMRAAYLAAALRSQCSATNPV